MIGNGVVIDPSALFTELDGLTARGVDCSRLLISASAHLIAPYHRTVDRVTERFLGVRRIGTTGRGIGPAYADKVNRIGLRVQDLFDEKILAQKVEGALETRNQLLVKVFNRRAITVDEVVEELLGYADRIRPMVCDTGLELSRRLDAGETVLFEGGQATMLDIDHGTYPFVTPPTRPRAGRAPARACRRTGSTGSSAWPRPTSRASARARSRPSCSTTSARAAPRRGEFGTTTGRPRRTGWYDALIARYTARVNGLTDLVLTKLDVLTGYETIPVCVGYDVDGVRHTEIR